MDSFADNAFFAYLHTLSAPALDLELRQLVRLSDLARFLRILAARLRAHRDFEAVQALVAVFTRIHGDVIIANGVRATERENGIEKEGMDVESVNEKNGDEEEDEDEQGQELAEALRAVMLEQHNEGNRVMELLSYCVGTLSFVRNLPLS